MHTKVSGKHIDIGDSLRTYVEERLAEGVTKYFDRPVDSAVVFSRDGFGFKCDASVHLPTGLRATAKGQNGEIHAAFDQAAERIEKQLRRYKRRLKDHHARREKGVEAIEAPAYVLAPYPEDEPDAAPDTGGAEEGFQPVIVAEMTTGIQTLSVGEAVMQMELAHAPFLMFKNDANGRFNLVFQRDDGNIGWVDPAIVNGE